MSVKIKINEDVLKKVMEEAVAGKTFEIECPHCHSSVRAEIGLHPCPQCGELIDLKSRIG